MKSLTATNIKAMKYIWPNRFIISRPSGIGYCIFGKSKGSNGSRYKEQGLARMGGLAMSQLKKKGIITTQPTFDGETTYSFTKDGYELAKKLFETKEILEDELKPDVLAALLELKELSIKTTGK